MNAIHIVSSSGKTVAIIYKKEDVPVGTQFLTPPHYPLQIGLIKRNKGDSVTPHIHNDLHYDVNITQEFIYIEQGKLIARFYEDTWEPIKECTLEAGDFMLSVGGGHSFEFLEDVRLIEVKQGPYPGDAYAKRFRK